MTIQTYRKTTVVEGATAPAPELLDALKAAEKFIGALPKPSVKKDFSGLNHLEQTLKEVRAAIAKATN